MYLWSTCRTGLGTGFKYSEFKPANGCGCTVTQQVSDDKVWTDKYKPCEKANPYYARYLADFGCKAGKKEFAC